MFILHLMIKGFLFFVILLFYFNAHSTSGFIGIHSGYYISKDLKSITDYRYWNDSLKNSFWSEGASIGITLNVAFNKNFYLETTPQYIKLSKSDEYLFLREIKIKGKIQFDRIWRSYYWDYYGFSLPISVGYKTVGKNYFLTSVGFVFNQFTLTKASFRWVSENGNILMPWTRIRNFDETDITQFMLNASLNIGSGFVLNKHLDLRAKIGIQYPFVTSDNFSDLVYINNQLLIINNELSLLFYIGPNKKRNRFFK